ncbi:MAG TPA: tRNA-dihydrouridine synthase, partial [Leptospiraceae bacterium]|nr:tRNA-dihydrouridine synthase [Leptospiraceae bacterium]
MILSPMANFSDSPFRKICRRMGSALSFSEFVPANSIAAGRPWALD